MKSSRRAKALFIFLSLVWLAVGSIIAHAAGATLAIVPATGSYATGKTFTVTVAVSSGGGTGVNAADGKIGFDPSVLAVQSVSKNNSVLIFGLRIPRIRTLTER
jgi:hypothetical protein